MIVRTVDVSQADESLSVVVEGAAEPIVVTVLSAAGVPLATGGVLLEGTTVTGLDVTLPAGTYTVQAVGNLSLAPSTVDVSIARTVRVK